MAGEEKKKQSVPDEVNGNGYDDTKNTSTGTGDSDYSSVYGTGNVVFPEVAQGNNAYQQWLKNQGLDIEGAYQQKVQQAQQAYAQSLAQNKAAYERQLGTYGANAESLAQSGLSASGYSDYLAGQAYAQQQAANVQAGQTLASSQQSALESAQGTAQKQYANYLSQVNEQAADIYDSLQKTGGTLSDEAKKYYETLGYSPEAITKAETLYSQYQATPEYAESQAKGALSAALQGTSLENIISTYGDTAVNSLKSTISSKLDTWANETRNMKQVLSDLGYNAESMSEEEQKNAFTSLLNYADDSTKSRVLTREMDNDFYTADRESDTERMNILQNSAKRIADLYDRGIISEDIKNNLSKKLLNKMSASLNNGKLSYVSSESDGRTETKTELIHPGETVQDNATLNKLNDLGDNINVAKIGAEYYVKGYVEPDGQPQWFKLKGLGKSKYMMDTIIKMTNALNVPIDGSGVLGKQYGNKISLYNKENWQQTSQKAKAEKETQQEFLISNVNPETAPPAVRGEIQQAKKAYQEKIFREMGYDPNNMTETEKMLAIKEWAEKQVNK